MADSGAQIRELAEQVREFLEPVWAMWMMRDGRDADRPLAQGTCGRSNLFLARVLNEAGLPAEFAAGTPLEGDFGYRGPVGWRGHAWVECGSSIVDVTADQFGGTPVVVAPLDDPRYKKGHDIADPEQRAWREAEVERLMPLWRDQMAGASEPVG